MWSKVEVRVLPSFSLMKPSELLCSAVTQTNKLWYFFNPHDIGIDMNFQNGVGFFSPLNTSLINFLHSPRMTVTKPDWQSMIGPISMHVWNATHPVSIWSFWRVESGAQNWWSGRQGTCQVFLNCMAHVYPCIDWKVTLCNWMLFPSLVTWLLVQSHMAWLEISITDCDEMSPVVIGCSAKMSTTRS